MKAYFALFSARFRMLLQYRAAAIAGFGTQLAFGLILVMILEAFYRSGNAEQPLTQAQAVTYTWLGQAFLGMLPYTANPDPEVRDMIRSGAVAYELTRPLDLYTLWYARAIASRSAPTLLRCFPLLFVAYLFLGMTLPPSLASGAAFLVSLLAALFLVSAFSVLITVSLMWTVSGDGIARLLPSLVFLCCGLIIPLPLFPDWAQGILNILPFRGMADAPFRLYLGHLPPGDVFAIVAHQLLWTLAFVLLGKWLVGLGSRRLVVQGG